jgi:hypothetical protein
VVTLLQAERVPEYGRSIIYGLIILVILSPTAGNAPTCEPPGGPEPPARPARRDQCGS